MDNRNQNKITSYNLFIKDSFNIIYNRPCLNDINLITNISPTPTLK